MNRRNRTRPTPGLERLEARALLSVAGGPDARFGTGGYAAVPLLGAGLPDSQAVVTGAAAQADGKVVASGVVRNPPGAAVPFVDSVARLDPDGSVDPTFGSGGVVGLGVAGSVAIQADGKVLVAGDPGGADDSAYQGTGTLARLNPDGTADRSFGIDGVVPLLLAGYPAITAERVAVQPDGKVLVAALGVIPGPALNGSPTGAAVLRFLADGRPDLSFGAGGIAPVSFGGLGPSGTPGLAAIAGLAVQPDGRIDLAGTATDDPAHRRVVVERLDASGGLDPSFGAGGVATLPAGTGGATTGSEVASDLLLQPDGKLVVAGAVTTPGSDSGPILAARLDPDGSLDPSFGRGGAAIVGGLGAGGTTATATLLPDGRVLLGSPSGFARLRPDGTLDPTFGRGGIATPGGSLVAPLPDGSALAISALGPAIARILPGGAPGDFDGDGRADLAAYLPEVAGFADRPSGGGPDRIVPYGLPGPGQTLPAPGAFDGGGRAEPGVYLPALGAFAYRPAAGGLDVIAPFGIPGPGATIPAVGDYDGDGRDDLAAYLPAYGAFAVRPSAGGLDRITPFGPAGPGQTLPAPGDYDGDGRADLAAYLPALGAFAYRPSGGGPDRIIPFGIPGAGQSIPAPGDFDGDGRADLAAYLPAYGAFAVRPSSGGPDRIIPFGPAGAGQTLPAPGDFDGDGRADLAAYLPALGIFAYRPSGGGPDVLAPFGPAGPGRTIPFSGAYSVASASGAIATASALAVPDFVPDPAPAPARPKA